MHAHKLGQGAVLAAVLTKTAGEVRADVLALASMVNPPVAVGRAEGNLGPLREEP
jgi:hypothetical protein